MERIFKSVIMEMKSVRDRMIKKSIIALFFLLAVLGPGLEAAVFTNIKIRNISDDLTNSVIIWTNITVLSQNWIVAEQYVSVDYLTNHAVITGWGIQIYTHNRTNIANPRYKGLSNANTLVDTTYSNFLLPMAWLIKTNKSKPARPKERLDHSGFSNYDWHFMTDRSTGGFTNEKDYYIPWNQGGIAWHEAYRQQKPFKAYIYFAAKFENLFMTRYQTSQLRVEEYNNPEARFINNFWLYTNAWLASPVPNHYTPSYENWGAGGAPAMEYNYTADYHSPGSCIRMWFGPNCQGADVWFEPYKWAPVGQHYGYDLTGVKRLTFWVKGSNNYVNLFYAAIGGAGESCGSVQNVDGMGTDRFNVTTSWAQHYIPVTNLNMSDVTRGFSIGVWNGATDTRVIYVDDIRYEK